MPTPQTPSRNEAAVEALERMLRHLEWFPGGGLLPVAMTLEAQEVQDARTALARLREQVPA